jgi:uncharacterized membrane protein
LPDTPQDRIVKRESQSTSGPDHHALETDSTIEIDGVSNSDDSATVKRQNAIVEMSMSHSGPLPHPSILRAYEAIIPGSAARILASSEIQAKHRQDLESTVIKANTRDQGRGQIFAFILAFVTIIGGIGLAYSGKQTSGMVAILTALGALVGVFIYGKNQQAAEREEKRS